MVFVYGCGKYLYLRGLLLLFAAALGESMVSYLYFGGVNWPNPLALLMCLSLVLLGNDRWRKLVSIGLIGSSIISFSALLGVFLTPATRNGGMVFYSFFFVNGLVETYVGWRIVRHPFVRFYLIGLRVDDKMRLSETDEDVREGLKALENTLETPTFSTTNPTNSQPDHK